MIEKEGEFGEEILDKNRVEKYPELSINKKEELNHSSSSSTKNPTFSPQSHVMAVSVRYLVVTFVQYLFTYLPHTVHFICRIINRI